MRAYCELMRGNWRLHEQIVGSKLKQLRDKTLQKQPKQTQNYESTFLFGLIVIL